MAISSIDILNLSHSLKDICEVDCDTPACLSQTLKLLLQYNLIQANLQFSRQLGQEDCPPAPICPAEGQAVPSPIPQRPSVRLDIGDPFLADHET